MLGVHYTQMKVGKLHPVGKLLERGDKPHQGGKLLYLVGTPLGEGTDPDIGAVVVGMLDPLQLLHCSSVEQLDSLELTL